MIERLKHLRPSKRGMVSVLGWLTIAGGSGSALLGFFEWSNVAGEVRALTDTPLSNPYGAEPMQTSGGIQDDTEKQFMLDGAALVGYGGLIVLFARHGMERRPADPTEIAISDESISIEDELDLLVRNQMPPGPAEPKR